MSLFLISFLGIYGCLHAYAFLSLRNAFRPAPPIALLLAGLMVLMIVAPVLVRVAERRGMEQLAAAIAWPAYVWMGFLLLFISSMFALDLLRLGASLVLKFQGKPASSLLGPTPACQLALLVGSCATIYGFFEANGIRSEQLTIVSRRIPASAKPIRIVQISDVHIGLIVGQRRLERILEVVRAARPDILVSTGDLVDGRLSLQHDVEDQAQLEQMLNRIQAPLGKFAVLGNHDVYVGLNQSVEFTRRAGFDLLRRETRAVTPFLAISGVDDPAAGGVKAEALRRESELLQAVEQDHFRILLKHRPHITSEGLFDLQLSGHTHQGQIFPFGLLVKLQYPLIGGTQRTSAGSTLHVSRGSGTWGPPLRVLAPPEVTIIDLIPAPAGQTN